MIYVVCAVCAVAATAVLLAPERAPRFVLPSVGSARREVGEHTRRKGLRAWLVWSARLGLAALLAWLGGHASTPCAFVVDPSPSMHVESRSQAVQALLADTRCRVVLAAETPREIAPDDWPTATSDAVDLAAAVAFARDLGAPDPVVLSDDPEVGRVAGAGGDDVSVEELTVVPSPALPPKLAVRLRVVNQGSIAVDVAPAIAKDGVDAGLGAARRLEPNAEGVWDTTLEGDAGRVSVTLPSMRDAWDGNNTLTAELPPPRRAGVAAVGGVPSSVRQALAAIPGLESTSPDRASLVVLGADIVPAATADEEPPWVAVLAPSKDQPPAPITQWRSDHPMLAGLRVSDLKLPDGPSMTPGPDDRVLVGTSKHASILLRHRQIGLDLPWDRPEFSRTAFVPQLWYDLATWARSDASERFAQVHARDHVTPWSDDHHESPGVPWWAAALGVLVAIEVVVGRPGETERGLWWWVLAAIAAAGILAAVLGVGVPWAEDAVHPVESKPSIARTARLLGVSEVEPGQLRVHSADAIGHHVVIEGQDAKVGTTIRGPTTTLDVPTLPGAYSVHFDDVDAPAVPWTVRAPKERQPATLVDAATLSVTDARHWREWARDEGGDLVLYSSNTERFATDDVKDAFGASLPIHFPPPPDEPPLAIVFLMDRSGSMGEQQRAPLALAALTASIERADERALIGLVAFSDFAEWLVPLGPRGDGGALTSALRGLVLHGGTDVSRAVDAGLVALEGVEASRKVLVVLTDGKSRTVVTDPPARLERAKADGITIHAIHLSCAGGRDELAVFAEGTGGTHQAVVGPEDLRQLLLDRMDHDQSDLLLGHALAVRPVLDSPLVGGVSWATAPALHDALAGQRQAAATAGLELREAKKPLLAAWAYGQGSVTVFAGNLKSFLEDWPQGALWLEHYPEHVPHGTADRSRLRIDESGPLLQELAADGSLRNDPIQEWHSIGPGLFRPDAAAAGERSVDLPHGAFAPGGTLRWATAVAGPAVSKGAVAARTPPQRGEDSHDAWWPWVAIAVGLRLIALAVRRLRRAGSPPTSWPSPRPS